MINNTDEIYQWKIEELWSALLEITDSTNKYNKQLEKIKYGFNYRIPISFIIHNAYERIFQSNKTKIIGFGKVNLQEFDDEIEKRKRTMRLIIEKETQSLKPTRARGL